MALDLALQRQEAARAKLAWLKKSGKNPNNSASVQPSAGAEQGNRLLGGRIAGWTPRLAAGLICRGISVISLGPALFRKARKHRLKNRRVLKPWQNVH